LENEFINIVQNEGRGLAARGKSSAASAAYAAMDAMKDLINPTQNGQWYSAVCSVW